MNPLIILKLGGSVATDKANNRPVVRGELIASAARQIRAARKKHAFRLLVVNGAGAFGHENVHRYRINEGVGTRKQFSGMCKTAIDCGAENQEICEILWENKVLAFPIPVQAITVLDNKRILHQDTRAIEELWKANSEIVPVLNGTFVPDIKLKGGVVSGDATIAHLARAFKAKRVLFGTDVDGVYTMDPRKHKGAQKYARIHAGNWQRALSGAGKSANRDVSGGMRGKLVQLGEKIRGIPIVVFDAQKPRQIEKALSGEPVGTLIKL